MNFSLRRRERMRSIREGFAKYQKQIKFPANNKRGTNNKNIPAKY